MIPRATAQSGDHRRPYKIRSSMGFSFSAGLTGKDRNVSIMRSRGSRTCESSWVAEASEISTWDDPVLGIIAVIPAWDGGDLRLEVSCLSQNWSPSPCRNVIIRQAGGGTHGE
jgi:hypothetical protein